MGTQVKSEFVFYRLNPTALATLQVPDMPLPVRKEREEQVFGKEGVQYDLLLDDLDAFLSDHPQQQPYYAEIAGTLAYLIAVKNGREGFHEIALHYLELGIQYNPESMALQTNCIVSLHNLGKDDEALTKFEVLSQSVDRTNLPLWLLVAKIYSEKGKYWEAYNTLKTCTGYLPAEDNFWEFLAEMQAKAFRTYLQELQPPTPPKNSAAQVKTAFNTQGVQIPTNNMLVCQKCRAEYQAGDLFCSGCGENLDSLKVCEQCGTPRKSGDVFCSNCGANIRAQ